MNPINHLTIFKALEKWAPRHLAYNWDNVGLQVGSNTTNTTKVLITLDVVESVVDEAIEYGANLIIAHHPLLLKPIQQINVDSLKGKVIQKLINHNITVYAAHTNLDIANGGINDLICKDLSLKNVEILRSEEHTSELQSRGHLVCRLLLEKKKRTKQTHNGGGNQA